MVTAVPLMGIGMRLEKMANPAGRIGNRIGTPFRALPTVGLQRFHIRRLPDGAARP